MKKINITDIPDQNVFDQDITVDICYLKCLCWCRSHSQYDDINRYFHSICTFQIPSAKKIVRQIHNMTPTTLQMLSMYHLIQ